MNILVNTRLLLNGKMEGIGLFTHNLMQQVVSNHPEHNFYFLFDRPYDLKFKYAENVIPIIAGPPARHPFLYLIWFEMTVPGIVKKFKIDAFFSPDHYLSLRTKVPTLLAVHDINFMHHPENLPLITSFYYRIFFPKFLQKAKRVIAVSEFTKNDVAQYFSYPKEKIDIVYNAPNMEPGALSTQEIEATKKRYTGGKPYFFYIGSLHKRKNIGRMMLAFDSFLKQSHDDVYLIIGGKAMWGDKDMEKDYQKIEYKEKIIFTGRLEGTEAKQLMGSSLALVFVSLFEGFGVPVIEAMSCGVPVITSNCSSMPEVAGDSAILADPLSVEEIKNAMIKVHSDELFRKELIEKGKNRVKEFSWKNSAIQFWNSFEKMLSQN